LAVAVFLDGEGRNINENKTLRGFLERKE